MSPDTQLHAYPPPPPYLPPCYVGALFVEKVGAGGMTIAVFPAELCPTFHARIVLAVLAWGHIWGHL